MACRCICNLIEPIANETDVMVVQHRREHRHPFGTARLVDKGLQRSELKVVWRLENHDFDFGFAQDAVLLFPGPTATPLSDFVVEGRPSQLVVVDGTWHQAKALLRDHKMLRALPRVSLRPERPSRYRIRREPQADFLSTVEATVAALRVLEPNLSGLERLLDAFETMIDWQLSSQNDKSARFIKRQRAHSGLLPRALRLPPEQIAVIYAESAAPAQRTQHSRERKPFQICVKYLGNRDGRSQIFLDSLPPAECHLAHMGIDPRASLRALSVDAAAAWLSEALGHCTAMVAWNRSTLDLVGPLVPHLAQVPLKSVFCNVARRPAGVLEHLVEELSLPLPEVCAVEGRAAARIAACEAVLAWLLSGQVEAV